MPIPLITAKDAKCLTDKKDIIRLNTEVEQVIEMLNNKITNTARAGKTSILWDYRGVMRDIVDEVEHKLSSLGYRLFYNKKPETVEVSWYAV